VKEAVKKAKATEPETEPQADEPIDI
jgi:hypothetical protein